MFMPQLHRLTPALCLSTALLLPVLAQAQSAAPANAAPAPTASASAKAKPSKGEKQAEMIFKMLDTNNDGYLTRNEVKAWAPLLKEFEAADADGNGRVSRDEIRVLSKKRLAERRARKAAEAKAKAASAP